MLGENKTYCFSVQISGTGRSLEEAWADALASFFADPGEPLTYREEEDAAQET